MNEKIIKAAIYFLVMCSAIGVCTLWFQTYVVGMYWKSAGIYMCLLIGSIPIFVGYVAYLLIKQIRNYEN